MEYQKPATETKDADEIREQFADHIDPDNLPTGERPPFPFPGAWLYCGAEPVVHLVGVSEQPEKPGKLPQLEHFAFSAKGLREFVGRLQSDKVRYEARKVPRSGSVQVNVWDPDGNHIHVDFAPEESAGIDLQEVTTGGMR